MDFKQFKQHSEMLSENSLFTSQAEKDALIADKKKLLDAFYINFFGFLGLFSINTLAPLKKYEQEEGKLFVDNISDTNKDVSLIIKLLFDEKILMRSVVDRMTKLLVKIKTKQIKTEDLNEDVVREILKDCRYTANRGSMYVMQPIMDFAEGKIQLKHLAYRLYMVAKKKSYNDITKEFRSIGIYYSVWFKKVGAHLDPAPGSVTVTQAATTQTIQQAQQAVTNPPTPSINSRLATGDLKLKTKVSPVADSVVAQTQPIPVPTPATKAIGKTPEFWLELYNARGKVEFNQLAKKYGVDIDVITIAEFTEAANVAMAKGKINLNDLSKAFSLINFAGSTTPYKRVMLNMIKSTPNLEQFIDELNEIKDDRSKRDIMYWFRASEFKAGEYKDIAVRLLNDFAKNLQNDTLGYESRNVLENYISNIISGSDVSNFPIENYIKLFSITRAAHPFNRARIFEFLKPIFPKTNFDQYSFSHIDKTDWENGLPKDMREIFDNFDMLNKLRIKLIDTSAFKSELEKIKTYADFGKFREDFIDTQISLQGNLNEADAIAIIDKVISVMDSWPFDAALFESCFGTLREKVSISIPTSKYHNKKEEYWNKVYQMWIAFAPNLNNDTLAGWAAALNQFRKYIVIPDTHKDILRSIEPKLLDYAVFKFKHGADVGVNVGPIIESYTSANFLNEYLKKIIPLFGTWYYSTFAYTPKNQIVTKEVADSLFDAMYAKAWKTSGVKSVISKLSNKDEFGEWLVEFVRGIKNIPPIDYANIIRFITFNFNNFKLSDDEFDLVFPFSPSEVSDIYFGAKGNQSYREILSKKILTAAKDENDTADITGIIQTIARVDDGSFIKDLISDDTSKEEISGLLSKTMQLLGANVQKRFDRKNWTYVAKEKYGFDLKVAAMLFNSMGDKVFSVPEGEQAVERLAEILATPSKIDKEYRESVVTDIFDLFTNADVNPETEKAFSKFEKKTQKMLAVNFATAQFAAGAIEEINKGGAIKARFTLPEKGALKVLKLNQVSIPASDIIDFRKIRGEASLKAIQDAAKKAAQTFKLEKQAVDEVDLSEDEKEKLSVVINRYNRYKHGGIAIKIMKVFNVSIGSQQTGWKEFLEETKAAVDNGTYYYKFPQFHGTASLPASMILRYGFSVIDEKLARDAGIKYAGRMLGDGIYSSNVIDKVAQYINDDAPTGVSRRRGGIGYIFEMETHGSQWGRSCNVAGADFATGGTGEFNGERGGLVSPEWAWKYANKQCKVKRCFEVMLIDKPEMDALVAKHKDVMESIGYKSFEEYLMEAKRSKVNDIQKRAEFCFMDNIIPIGNRKYFDLNEEDPSKLKLPKGVRLDFGMYGAIISIESETDYNIRMLYGSDIETNASVRKLYFKLMGIK